MSATRSDILCALALLALGYAVAERFGLGFAAVLLLLAYGDSAKRSTEK